MSDLFSSEDEWIADERTSVEEYLQRHDVDHLGVGEGPAFYVYPYLALWAVQSKKSPGSIGWWAISGDLPTDYISSDEGRHPREALRAIAAHWVKASEAMLSGKRYSDYSIGDPEQWPELGDLLKRRALIIQRFADDEMLWADE
ncbi:MAG: DUF4826 family protein [Acidobacteriota bacterium]|nr:DUF4826 family protein [Acidobacteriota bacterium]